ncbi:MAG: 23S rRNA (adenine(1618)-N(6))-methyltransferase RlmF [Campylobacterota bacterium]|nr:23S rRNA (adenine(1618)-N(6))-methyltransferase RlmF [Campylobacterota bacterium]
MKTKKDTKTLHRRNLHNSRYDFPKLIKSNPTLNEFVALNKYNDLSIDFSNPKAVMALNQSLLSHFYNVKEWSIPQNYLCPPIPGRADYIHYISDLLPSDDKGKVPRGKHIKVLDIGIGANCIYPIIGSYSYGWSFIGSDIDRDAIENVTKIIKGNKLLSSNIEIIFQPNKHNIFKNIINENDKFYFTICNPPFHSSAQDAIQGTKRKVKSLTKAKEKMRRPTLNFGGQADELWCDGGEISFITKMINESKEFSKNCFWFTTLVSKQDNLEEIYKILNKLKPVEVKTLNMQTGNKMSRIVAWTFLTKEQQNSWNKNLNKEAIDAK